ncbi:SOS response regulatory protein OraA/RecX [Pseudonocardia hierapolitana]|uniref:Regulatory protein RecX n=1 Tax=Pseudonocardia hierapolitana TaxID=1128676 RepID=A0A561SHN2_9PSEU|nr:SOS response regulatory protein OraA/RecX [Pseudonocardia hierapolitana]
MADGRRPHDPAADGRVARFDGIAAGGEGSPSAPVARFGELLAAEATPEPADGSPVPVGPADLRELTGAGNAPAAPVADFAPRAPVDGEPTVGGRHERQSAAAGEPGPIALFDNPSLGADRDDVAVVELGPGALNRSAARGGRQRTGGGAARGGSRRAAGAPGREPEHRGAGENRGARGRRRPTSPVEPPTRSDHDPGRDPAADVDESDGPARADADEPRGRPRDRRGRGPEELDPDADPIAVAREVCLRLLTDRARTRQELAQALRRKGVPDDAAHTVLERFDEVGLIDDAAFAGQWVRSRHTHRGLARRAIAVELRRKGVSEEAAGEALAEVDAEAEERRARELVDRKLRSLAVGTSEQRATAGRRLVGMLARKGYGAGIAYRVVKEALAERGAEVDELADGEIPDD